MASPREPQPPRPIEDIARDLSAHPAFPEMLAALDAWSIGYFEDAVTASADSSRDRIVSLLAKADARRELLRLLRRGLTGKSVV